MNLDEKVGEKLKKLRDEKDWSTREVARRINISYSYVSKIENGKIPSLTTLQKLCDLYEVNITELFGKEVDTPDELKGLGVEWITFAEDMKKQELTPEEIKEFIKAVKTIRGLS